MSKHILDRNNIRKDLLVFINVVKEFDKLYINDVDMNCMDYEAVDYENGFVDFEDLEGDYEVAKFSRTLDVNEKEIPDTWLDEIDAFTDMLKLISTENLYAISKIISLGKEMLKVNNENNKVIVFQNEYLSNILSRDEEFYESREDIIEDLFSKRGELLIKCAELGAEKLNIF